MTDSRRTESARNPIAAHAKFGDDSALNALMRTQWTVAFTDTHNLTELTTFNVKLKCTTRNLQLKQYSSVIIPHNGSVYPTKA